MTPLITDKSCRICITTRLEVNTHHYGIRILISTTRQRDASTSVVLDTTLRRVSLRGAACLLELRPCQNPTCMANGFTLSCRDDRSQEEAKDRDRNRVYSSTLSYPAIEVEPNLHHYSRSGTIHFSLFFIIDLPRNRFLRHAEYPRGLAGAPLCCFRVDAPFDTT